MAGFRVEGAFTKNTRPLGIASLLRETGKKEFSLDGQVYDRLANHIGLIPAVMIAPDDVQIITGNSEERRRYLDTLFSQLDPQYLQELILHNRVLQQRNAYLKSVDDRRLADHGLLDAYDGQLVKHALAVFSLRTDFIDSLVPLITQFYGEISGLAEQVDTRYESQLANNDYGVLLKTNREKDLAAQRTTAGIHKDELIFELVGRSFKSEASQGQRKSLLFALKLAEFSMLQQKKGFEPILLLDDVFEKLDENRIQNLLTWVCLRNQGQIFITDTHAERFVEHITRLGIEYQLLEL
jgi:DNA replication and repair protein RecF